MSAQKALKAEINAVMNGLKPNYPIGTVFKRHYKDYKETVIDILTTTNNDGEVIRIRYAAKHIFCGQEVVDIDVTETTIKRALFND